MNALSTWVQQSDGRAIVMANHQIELFPNHATRLWYLESGSLLSDQPTSDVNWSELRQTLVTTEQQAQAEWS